jgi:hypothetical protein
VSNQCPTTKHESGSQALPSTKVTFLTNNAFSKLKNGVQGPWTKIYSCILRLQYWELLERIELLVRQKGLKEDVTVCEICGYVEVVDVGLLDCNTMWTCR